MEKRFARSSSCRARSSTSSPDGRAWLWLGALLLVLMTPLAGCGFTPLYADRAGSNVAADLSMLDVKAPNNTLGRELKYNLLDILSSSGNPPANAPWVVELAPSFYEEDVAIESDAEVTRKNVVLVVPFRLVDTETGKPVLRSTARARSSYDRVDSEFANIVAAEDAQKRVAKVVADDIKLQLGIHFDRQARSDTAAGAGAL
jgi:LPS-assembly lipoprotein